MLPAIKCRVDTQNWMRAQQVILDHSRSLPREALPRAVAFVVNAAKNRTPVTPISQIDSELKVMTIPRISPRTGRPVSKNTRNSSNIAIGDKNTLAMRIMLARLHPYSNYNILTDQKYLLDRRTFSPGSGAAGFWARLNLFAQRMVKSRHSSSGFFKISWNAILGALIPMVPAEYRGAVAVWAGREGRKVASNLGAATLRGGNLEATLMIENFIGMDPSRPTISAIRNMEAHRILGAALQQAIDANYEQQLQLIARKKWMDKKPLLRNFGFMVK